MHVDEGLTALSPHSTPELLGKQDRRTVRITIHIPNSSYFAGRVLSKYSLLSLSNTGCSTVTAVLHQTRFCSHEDQLLGQSTLNSNTEHSFAVEPSFKVSLNSNGVTAYWLDDQKVGAQVPVQSRIFILPYDSDWFWGPPSPLSNGYWWLFPQE
jgi:hypothetical protein